MSNSELLQVFNNLLANDAGSDIYGTNAHNDDDLYVNLDLDISNDNTTPTFGTADVSSTIGTPTITMTLPDDNIEDLPNDEYLEILKFAASMPIAEEPKPAVTTYSRGDVYSDDDIGYTYNKPGRYSDNHSSINYNNPKYDDWEDFEESFSSIYGNSYNSNYSTHNSNYSNYNNSKPKQEEKYTEEKLVADLTEIKTQVKISTTRTANLEVLRTQTSSISTRLDTVSVLLNRNNAKLCDMSLEQVLLQGQVQAAVNDTRQIKTEINDIIVNISVLNNNMQMLAKMLLMTDEERVIYRQKNGAGDTHSSKHIGG